MTCLRPSALSLLLVLGCVPEEAGLRADHSGAATRSGQGGYSDFDGDGYSDLAVYVGWEEDSDPSGAVHAFQGSAPGLSGAGDRLWDQDALLNQSSSYTQAPGSSWSGFSGSLAVGDLNGDGYADLVVGVAGASGSGTSHFGRVSVIYGTSSGLTSIGSESWSQDSSGIEGTSEDFDAFGSSLIVGDFNGDGYGDLVVGVPGEGIGAVDGAGSINVIYGSFFGLVSTGNQAWSQDSSGIGGASEAHDGFGEVLAVGDFNCDDYMDLAVGVPEEDLNGEPGAGMVNVIYGSSSGLTSTGSQVLHQDVADVSGSPEYEDGFGEALVGGDFDDDGCDDLAVGVPREAYGTLYGYAGMVHVFYGDSAGLSGSNEEAWTLSSIASEEQNSQFGRALTAGDFDGDGHDDLAIGIPTKEVSGVLAGAVGIMYGSSVGILSTGSEILSQDVADFTGGAEYGDRFGASLSVGNYNGDAYADLVIGVPEESIGTVYSAGAIHVVLGASSGLDGVNEQMWYQDLSTASTSESYEGFGAALPQ